MVARKNPSKSILTSIEIEQQNSLDIKTLIKNLPMLLMKGKYI